MPCRRPPKPEPVTIEGTGASVAARLAAVKEPSVTSLNGSIGKTMTILALSDSLLPLGCAFSRSGRELDRFLSRSGEVDRKHLTEGEEGWFARAVPRRDLTDPPLVSQGSRDTLNLYVVRKHEVKTAKDGADTVIHRARGGENPLDAGVRASCHQHPSIGCAQRQRQLPHLASAGHVRDHRNRPDTRDELRCLLDPHEPRTGPWGPVADRLRWVAVVILHMHRERRAARIEDARKTGTENTVGLVWRVDGDGRIELQ